MATTANYGWSTPDDTSLVKDGASAIRTLGSSIDTTVFNNASAAIAKSIIDAKADLITATAADTPARLAVGTNGQYLQADSTTATGLKWATLSATPNEIPRLNANYYASNAQTSNAAGLAVIDENYYLPIYLPACTISRLAVRTSSAFSGTASVRLGLYNNGTNNIPDTVLIDGGTVSCTSASTTYEVTVNQSVNAGWYWTAFRTVSAAATNSFTCNSGSSLAFNVASTSTFTSKMQGISENNATGAFATANTANFSIKTGSGELMLMGLRIN